MLHECGPSSSISGVSQSDFPLRRLIEFNSLATVQWLSVCFTIVADCVIHRQNALSYEVVPGAICDKDG